MSYKKLQLLSIKLADKINLDNSYEKQRNILSKFYEEFSQRLDIIQQELLGDYLELKESWIKFPTELRPILKNIIIDVLRIYKNIVPENPYSAAKMLVDYLSIKQNKILIDNFDFIVSEMLKKNKWDQNRFRGTKSLIELGDYVNNFMKQNPLLPIPGMINKNLPKERISDFPKKEVQINKSNNDLTYVDPNGVLAKAKSQRKAS